MVKISLNVCDVCRDPRKQALRYRLTGPDRTASMELCSEDAAPLEVMLKKHGRRPAERRTFENAVTTIEEIEAQKVARDSP